MPEETTTEEEREVPILSRLRPPAGAVRPKLRVGRGVGSGTGKTGGRGQKGQKARKPGNIHKLHFQGGQTPLVRQLPKFGFKNIFAKKTAALNLRDLGRFDAGAVVNEAALREAGLVKGKWDRIKILGQGELTHALTVEADAFSKSAKAKIEAAGGTATVRERTPAQSAEAASE